MCDSVNDYILCETCAADDQIKESGVPAATMLCITCEERQCESCSKVHRKQEMTKDHHIVPIEEKVSEMKEPQKSDKRIIFCDSCNAEEENENDEIPTATMFCTNCEENQCDSCSQVHRKQEMTKDHNIVPIDEIAKEKVNEMREPSKSDDGIFFCDSCNADKHNENDEVPTATMHCIKCVKNHCDTCSSAHKNQENPKDHTIVPIDEYTEKLSSNVLIDRTAETGKILNVKPFDDASKAIWGVAKINDDLFLLGDSSRPKSSESEIWQMKKESLQYLWKISGIPLDMAGDSRNLRLYISRCIEPDNEIMISVHDMNEAGSPCETPTHSWRLSSHGRVHIRRYATLSITAESNILLTVMESRKLVEYTYNGAVENVHRKIEIDDIANPLHAVKQSNDTYVVCHGENHDEKHRVCIVNARGHLLKDFCLRTYSDANMSVVPMYLALGREGSIIVAENRNGRVLQLNADLTVAKVLLTIKDGMRGPCRLHLDETSGKIIVASNGHGWRGGQLLIRDI